MTLDNFNNNWNNFQRLTVIAFLALSLMILLSSCSSCNRTQQVPSVLLLQNKVECHIGTNKDIVKCFVKTVSALKSSNEDKRIILTKYQ